jgi:hypothetical protein
MLHLNSVNELIALFFFLNMTDVKDIRLEIKFQNFRLEDHESIEDIYFYDFYVVHIYKFFMHTLHTILKNNQST